jgi:hypothetical protein
MQCSLNLLLLHVPLTSATARRKTAALHVARHRQVKVRVLYGVQPRSRFARSGAG